MAADPWAVFPDTEQPPPSVLALARAVESDGGRPLGVYEEPVGHAWQIFALLPIDQVQPTPYQRDLSPAHAKRLKETIKKLNRFVDPIVVVRHAACEYWTPNGNHRRDALRKLKAKHIPVILIPEPEVAFQILALNTEKAHNLKEKSLEVIRMFRGLMEEAPRSTEDSYAFQFEEPCFLTLGLIYEKTPRFSGSLHAPVLRRVDRFLEQAFPKAYVERQRRAEMVALTDTLLTDVVARLKRRGVVHPYIKNFVIARVNPLTRARKTMPSFDQALTKIHAALEAFDVDAVKPQDIARAAVGAPA